MKHFKPQDNEHFTFEKFSNLIPNLKFYCLRNRKFYDLNLEFLVYAISKKKRVQFTFPRNYKTANRLAALKKDERFITDI